MSDSTPKESPPIASKQSSENSLNASLNLRDPRVQSLLKSYWRKNLGIMAVLLVIWACAGLGCGVLFADALNAYRLGGFPLGFWFAQQGSIITFVLLILVYCLVLNRLDAQHLRELKAMTRESEGDS